MPITHAVRLLPQVQSAQSLVKLLANIPAATIVQQVGRRPLLIGRVLVLDIRSPYRACVRLAGWVSYG